jgi:hypothetical protein
MGFEASEHAGEDLPFVLINFPEILGAAVALDAPETGRQEFGGRPAMRVAAVGKFNNSLSADADEIPVAATPGVEAGLVVLAIAYVLKEVVLRMGIGIVLDNHLKVDFGSSHGSPPFSGHPADK